jgi:hypothetical protein
MAPPSDIAQVREIPLESILACHDLTSHREGSTTRYKNDQFNIVTTGNGLWFDNAASVGGRGAIDLILHLKFGAHPRMASDRQFHEAIDWLETFQPGTGTEPPAQGPPKATLFKESFASQAARLAIRDDARWPMAQSYLIQTRRLPADMVNRLHDRGNIYASVSQLYPEQTGVCFVHRNLQGEARGATIRSIAAGPGYAFSIGEKAGAWFALGDPAQVARAVLVEAPIDAISYAALREPQATVVLAMSGSHASRAVLEVAHERRWEMAIGFDNDRAGHAGWERCRENYEFLYPDDPQPSRIIPRGKDWNEDLMMAPRLNRGRRP